MGCLGAIRITGMTEITTDDWDDYNDYITGMIGMTRDYWDDYR